jgi:integrase/recombinase XerD
MQQAPLTVKGHLYHIRKFLKAVNKPINQITREDVRRFLSSLMDKHPETYKNYLNSLRRFLRDYLQKPELINGFKQPRIPLNLKPLPDKVKLQTFYNALPSLREKTLFLLLASSGLRLNEVLNLTLENLDLNNRIIYPNKKYGSQTKSHYVSFFNHECLEALTKYIEAYKPRDKLFNISRKRVQAIFHETSLKVGFKITPQTLRAWFSTEMAKKAVPDRYIDAFQGRIPRSTLARHYTDYTIETLKQIYTKANLTILT